MSDRAASRDELRYRRTLAIACGALLVTFAAGSAAQGPLLTLVGAPVSPETSQALGARLAVNLAASAIVLAGVVALPVARLGWPARILALAGVGVAAGLLRAVLQLLFGIHDLARPMVLLADLPAPAVTTAVAMIVGVAVAESDLRARRQERDAAEQSLRATRALELLQAEELRVRRDVAEGLHGTVQQNLVLLEQRVRAVRERVRSGEAGAAAELDDVLSGLADMRERDVRAYARLLYPTGVEAGLAAATRSLLQRLPRSIAVDVRIDDAVRRLDDPEEPLPIATRILAIRVIEEGVTNALRHGRAGRLRILLGADDRMLTLVVEDDGEGLGAEAGEPSGLARLTERLDHVGGRLRLSPGADGGTRLEAEIPVPASPRPARAAG